MTILRGISWTILPLVAGLFVIVDALGQTGVVSTLATSLSGAASHSPTATAGVAGVILAFGSNLVNNLPAGLIASTAIAQVHPPQLVTDALLIGIDLGPNLSITGSLATILWLPLSGAKARTSASGGFSRSVPLSCRQHCCLPSARA
jgi:arsenical pump membrane protein